MVNESSTRQLNQWSEQHMHAVIDAPISAFCPGWPVWGSYVGHVTY